MALRYLKEKMGSLFFLPGDFVKGELNLVASKSVSHLVEYL